jgi:para-nitrobenzyl esterase
MMQNQTTYPGDNVNTKTKFSQTALLGLALSASLLGWAQANEKGGASMNVLKIEGGQIAQPAANEQGLHIYKGIPFAAPPVGDLRWKPPQAVNPWQGTLTVDQWGARCYQSQRLGALDPNNPNMSEDCLYLNVWAPSKAKGLPVMVWIHGGSNLNGAASQPEFDAAAWAKRGVVAVSINYRVDVFGFMAHPELTAESGTQSSGNYGLLDQIAALKWVQRNIAQLGGDPKNVTILGESAGAIDVSLLLVSPLSKGLFQKAVGQSGSALVPFGLFSPRPLAQGEAHGLRMADALGAKSVAQMRQATSAEVLQASAKQPSMVGLGVIDGYVVPESPTRMMLQGKGADVPLLLGSNADEGSLFSARMPLPPNAAAYEALITAQFKGQAPKALALYPAGAQGELIKSSFSDLIGDQIINYGTWAWADRAAKNNRAPVYRYFFSRRPPLAPELSIYPLTAPGAYHFAEVVYAFDNLAVRPDWGWQKTDHTLAKTMADYWTHFAKTGNPNGSGLPQWPAYKAPSNQVMGLGENIGVVSEPHPDRYQFLDAFYTIAAP